MEDAGHTPRSRRLGRWQQVSNRTLAESLWVVCGCGFGSGGAKELQQRRGRAPSCGASSGAQVFPVLWRADLRVSMAF